MPTSILSALGTIAPDLRAWYKSAGNIGDMDAMLGIEKRFGEWLVQNLCIPHHQSQGECLIYALTVAKGVEA